MRRWLLGDLSQAEADAIGQHISECNRCELEMRRIEGGSESFFQIFESSQRDASNRSSQALAYTQSFHSSRESASDTTLGSIEGIGQSESQSFLPGAILADRYRIVSLIGRGGMGEVYRADDMRLGQSVALKFLLGRNANNQRTQQYFLDEVRLSQRLSHPHICRVHDLVECDDRLFLSMEYIEGENLSDLLKRVGPLPQFKASELSGQLCQGLAAAHDAGVLHRDLKPANIMIDQRGRARITDFGLAREHGAFNPAEGVVGTPLYMAPEQLKQNQTSVQSDLYSLGLILYEMYTGRKAHRAKSTDEISELHKSSAAVQAVREAIEIAPEVGGAVASCLALEPRDRPASVAALAAALPGQSSLAVAVAAGETLSPALIAISGPKGALQKKTIAGLMLCLCCVLAVVMWLSASAISTLGSFLSPRNLSESASELLNELSVQRGDFQAWGYAADKDAMRWRSENGAGLKSDFHTPANEFLHPSYYWYRESADDLAPLTLDFSGDKLLKVDEFRPPLQVGSVLMRWGTDGRLMYYERQRPTQEIDDAAIVDAGDMDWSMLFRHAGLSDQQIKNLSPAEPKFAIKGFADSRRSWLLPLNSHSGDSPATDSPASELSLCIDAASSGGQPVFFRVSGPWNPPKRELWQGSLRQNPIVTLIFLVWLPLMMLATAYFARKNLYSKLADQEGAIRVAGFSAALVMMVWIVGGAHVRSSLELDLFLTASAASVLMGAVVWCTYVAFEPVVRREYPITLVSWTRLLEGKFRDQLLGRHLLIGILAGAAVALAKLTMVHFPVLIGGEIRDLPNVMNLLPLNGGRHLVGEILTSLGLAVLFSVFYQLLLLIVLRLLIRKMKIAVTIFVVFLALRVAVQYEPFWFAMLISVLEMSLTAFLFLRVGLFSVVTMHFARLMLKWPMSLDASDWYAGNGWISVGLLVVLAISGAANCWRRRSVSSLESQQT